jgi:hypothetical protein
MKRFNREDIEYFLPNTFKGLSKEYILECIFDEDTQKNWKPTGGDIIVTRTGNIFIIGGEEDLHENLGGTMWYFGGGACSRDGEGVMNNTYCFSANESGRYKDPIKGEVPNPFHVCIRDFRFVPYPHERIKIKK